MTICVLGRQPEIGLAELEALYGSDRVRPAGAMCALVDAEVDFSRLGGSVKIATLLSTIHDTSRKSVFKKIGSLLPRIIDTTPARGKLKIGISVYGFDITPYELGGEALRLKKIARSKNRSARVVPNETPALSSAQTFHNHLTGDVGIEFIVVQDDNTTHIGRVTHVQDIDAYRIRDRERPKRDAFVGMLPPKLAQTIINLATGQLSQTEDAIILDPFCGTGVVMQEALLMGYSVYGTDVSKKMIDYSQINLKWLEKNRPTSAGGEIRLEVADATDHIWRQPISVIACETYLGQPLGGQSPSGEKLAEIIHTTNTVIRGFFDNIAPQLTEGTKLCVAVPVWFANDTVSHLPVIEDLESIGFVSHSFVHAATPLMYHREDQTTGRELLVLERKRSELTAVD